MPPKQVNPELARLTSGVSLQQLLSENLWFSQQETFGLESTAMAAFQAVSWLDLWSLTVSKVAANSGGISPEDDSAFRRLLPVWGRSHLLPCPPDGVLVGQPGSPTKGRCPYSGFQGGRA